MITIDTLGIDAAKLKAARGTMKQYRAAALLGITQARLSYYESGRSTPPGDVLARMCALYGVSIGSWTGQQKNNLQTG